MSDDWLNEIKARFKRNPRLYQFLVDVISPVYVDRRKSFRIIYQYLSKSSRPIVVNIGSGPFSLDPEIISVDFNRYKNVHVVSDIHHLPFKDGSVDAIINVAVLEHVKDPRAVVAECHRVLKKDGYVYSVVPFIVGFHAAPEDYYRYTREGVIRLHEKFSCVDIGVYGGPTSGFLWILQEWLALLFSFGSNRLYRALYLLFMCILWPIKFLDVLLVRYADSSTIASTFYYVGKKTKPIFS